MDGRIVSRSVLTLAIVLGATTSAALGQESTSASPPPGIPIMAGQGPTTGGTATEVLEPCPATLFMEEAPEAPPLENPYAGDLLTRTHALGDPLGLRSRLADKGLTADLYLTQFYQGVVSGGRVRDWEYGGKGDYYFNMDGGKLGLWQGLFVNMHAETRLGSDVNNIDGLLAPANIAMNFPADDQDITSITGLKITQALSENFALFAGKINTLDEYPLHYSTELGISGPGRGGFMNTSLVFNPILARTIPYSAAGAGGAILREGEPVFAFTVFDPEERATTGLQDLYDRGVTLVADLILRVKPNGRPGVYNIGGSYSNSRYRSFDPAAYLDIPLQDLQSGVAPEETGSWSLYANFYQALWVDPCDEKRGWGVFGQAGISDGNPNPIWYVLTGGIGGRSMLARRKLDTFGIGFFYLGLSDEFKTLSGPLVPQQDEYGVELFYNIAVTPWCRLTPDFQAVRPSTQAFDTAIITGLRLQLLF